MNRSKYGRMSMLVALTAVMALVLQGCGGDDNSGVEQDLRDQIAALEGQVSDAQAATAAAEAARMTAEDAAAAAMAAQMAAETERDAANTAKGMAEAQAAAAMAAQMTAEEAQAAAEMAQMTAEEAQAAAETAQAVAEAERDAAAGSLSAAEMARDAAQEAEAAAKVAEAEAMAAQMAAEGERDDAEAAQMAAEAAQMAAEMERDAANAAKMMAEEAQAAAEMAQAMAEQAAMDAAAAQAMAEQAAMDAAAAQMTAEMERDAAMAAQATAEKAQMDAEAAQAAAEKAAMDARAAQKDAEDKAAMYKAQLDALQGVVDTGEMAGASAAAKELLDMALVDANFDADTTSADVNDPAAPTIGVSVSTGGMLMARASGYTMDDMPADMIEGWRGATLMDRNGNTAVVYSDIGNDGTKSLFDRYSSNLPTDDSPRSYPVGGSEVTTGAAANPIPWNEVMRPDEMTTVGGSSSSPITMFRGTVHDIPGTFSCDTADTSLCTAPERYSDGSVNGTTGGLPTTRANAWTFVPDEGVPTFTDDENYLVFGWWLAKGDDGMPEQIRLITNDMGLGDDRTAADTAGTIRGTATYNGAAAGKYAMASQTDDTYEGGHFTAMATLEVDFDADLDPGTPGNDRTGIALSGMIDNFMTGATSRPDWTVKLMVDGDGATSTATNIPLASLVGDTDATMTTEWSTGTAQTGTGTWTANFIGGGATELPMAATGTFNAHIGGTGTRGDGAVGRIQGAFGANKAE